MSAGVLSDRVAFDEPAGSSDAFGGTSVVWTEVYRCAAEIRFHRGDEAVKAARLAGRNIYKVRVRSCSETRGITSACRMRDVRRGTSWNIIGVDAVADRAFVHLTVEGPSSEAA